MTDAYQETGYRSDAIPVLKPGDPPWEGVHTFYNARDRMRQRRKAGEVGPAYPFF